MPGDARVQELLEAILDSGSTPEELCRASPELLPLVRERWQRLRAVEEQICALFPHESTLVPGDTPQVWPQQLPRIPGYEVEAILGRGGMGVVFKAWHVRLHRPVALKMLLVGACATSAERQRFLREAEAAAALRHANIVQVHDVGDHDGRMYFTMEFVEGGSLADKLVGAPQPARQAAALVITLAGAVQAAHQGGIVHRDLKPANVLLAADGTPKISDFGLARRLERSANLTQSGTPMGTPSYMAPEQAQGKSRALGPAVDTYALGAILYELLTGRPPFLAETALETLQQVISQDPLPPSRLNAKVPRDLETICLKCLRKEPERRYSSARELADDLERFVRGESVVARPAGVVERARKWVLRRPAAAALLAAVVLLVVAAGIGAWLIQQQRAIAEARQTQTDQEVHGSLERARILLEEGWLVHDTAKLTAARAEGNRVADIARSGDASAAVQREAEAFREDAARRLEGANKNLALREALLDVLAPREPRADARDGGGRVLVPAPPSVDEQYAAAFRRWGLDVDGSPEAAVADRMRQEPDVVVQELIAGLDAWSINRRWQGRPEAEWRRLVRVADRLDRSDQRRLLRVLLAEGSWPRAENVAGLLGAEPPWPALWELGRGNAWRRLLEVQRTIDPRTEPVPTVLLLAWALVAVGDVSGAEEVLHQAAAARPDQVQLLHALGKLLDERSPSRLEEAIGYYRAARVQRPQLGIALSSALARAGKATQGEDVLRDLTLRQPDNAAIHSYLGLNLVRQRKHSAAEAACRRAIDLQPGLAEAHCNLGYALHGQGKYGEAEAACRRAIHLKPDLIEAHCNLGTALHEQARHSEAEAVYRTAMGLRPDVAEVCSNLGNVLYGQKRYAEAEAACRRAIALKPDFAAAYNNLGNALHEQGRPGEAEAAYRRAIGLKPDYAEAYCNLGNALNELREHVAAEAASRRAISLKPDLADSYNNLGTALIGQHRYGEADVASRRAIALKPDFALAYNTLGTALEEQGRHREAAEAYRRATELKPDFAEGCYHLGNALFRQGEHGKAIAALRKAIELRPNFANAYNNLGMALGLQEKHAEAEAAFRKAIDLAPDLANAHINLGSALLGQEKPVEAEATFRRAINLNPDFGLAHHKLGIALMRQARFDEAAASLDKSASLFPAKDPRQEQARQLQQQCQRYLILDARLPAILRGTAKPAGAAEQLELAQLCGLKNHHAAAARFYGDAFAAEHALAENVPAATRYSAACTAVLAGCGQGKDADKLEDKERARWRRQALEWLRQDLAWWGKRLDNGDEQVPQRMRQWQTDPSLTGVRDKDGLARLPDEERELWESLWSEVDALVRRGSGPE